MFGTGESCDYEVPNDEGGSLQRKSRGHDGERMVNQKFTVRPETLNVRVGRTSTRMYIKEVPSMLLHTPRVKSLNKQQTGECPGDR